MSSKMRYYLRGLGVGILIAALMLILSHHFSSTEMTDLQIRERALQLGMVDPENMSLTQAVDVQESTGPVIDDTAEAADSPVIDDTAETVDSPVIDDTTEVVEEPGTEESGDGDIIAPDEGNETDEPADVVEEPEPEPEPDTQPEEEPDDTPKEGTVTIVIKSGMGSESVARAVKDAGLVESADEFDTYLEKHGYSRKLRVGTYEVPYGATMEEMAILFTTSKN